VLIIRDGWGENPNPSHDAFNAPKLASLRGLTPVDDGLRREWPMTLIKTSGEDVGLPGTGDSGTMGNSEVGHQNIGAGRIVPQESLVMTKSCESGLHTNEAIKAAVERCVESRGGGGGRSLHLMGICSDAGVHGLLEHLYAILRAAKALGLHDRVFLHMFTDGRDSGPYTGIDFVRRVEARCAEIGVGRVVTVAGRYYAMDRDHRWERVKLAFDCLTRPGGAMAASAAAAIQAYYDAPSGETLRGDEFVTPTAIGSAAEVAASRIKNGDSVVFFNYRGDRPRELSAAFCFPDAEWAKVKPSPDTGNAGFDRGAKLGLHYTIMTEYWEKLLPHVQGVAFPKPPKMKDIAGLAIADAGLRQFRCAETEKYPHVTFFFNDYRDEPFPGERRENPQSPRVATYDLKPEMAAPAITEAVLGRLSASDCEDVLIVNYANGDMVGHTGNLEAAIKACACVDEAVGRVMKATLALGGSVVITADHGNCEQMFDPTTNSPHTAHTIYDVPLFVVCPERKATRLRGDGDATGWFRPETRAARGRLGDVMPTVFELAGIAQPEAMTGRSLLVGEASRRP